MKEEEAIEVKKAIEQKIADLKDLIINLKEATKPMGLDNSVGRLSRMDYINNKTIDEASLRKAENSLQALERWLSVYGTEKFGKCVKCNNAINVNRLLLMPESSRCIRCAGR
jgi:DnaK suppressor protein